MKQGLCLLLMFFSLSVAAPGQVQQSPCPLHSETSTFDPATNSTVLLDCHKKPLSNKKVEPSDVVRRASTGGELWVDPDIVKSTKGMILWQNAYTERIFDHQATYTLFIFTIVNLLVLAGLYFAWIQFNATLHISRRMRSASAQVRGQDAAPAPDRQGAGPQSTEQFGTQQLKIGPDGIAISSSFIGLIILGFSMGFYLMYLSYVYPIRTIESSSPPSATVGHDSR